MAQTTLTAEPRTPSGKGGARETRRGGHIPAIIYGRGREPESLAIPAKEFERVITALKGDVRSTVFDLSVGKKSVSALIREVQRHPVDPEILHIDFYEIHAGEMITLEIQIHLVGIPDGVRNAGGILDQALREVEIEVLPKNIPEHLKLDVTDLKIGDSLHVSDLKVENVEFLTDLNKTICSVIPPRTEEVAVEPGLEVEEEDAEPEVIRKPKDEEPGSEE